MRPIGMIAKRQRIALLLISLACSAIPGGAWADSRVWLGGNGDWFTPTNWVPEGLPQAGDSVQIGGGSLLLTNVTPELSALSIGNATLTFSNAVALLRAASVSLNANGIMTHAPVNSAITPFESNRVAIACVDLTIDPQGAINVNTRGYRGGSDGQDGQGPGGGSGSTSHSAQYGGGAGYGGRGGNGNYNSVRGTAYDTAENPDRPGSGGARSGGAGHGGGLVRIEAAGAVTVNGAIQANGGNCSHANGGGGSGGGIFIEAGVFGGTGQITAHGGNGGASNGGGGGGGRIALRYAAIGASVPELAALPGLGGAENGLIGSLSFPDTALQDRFSAMSGLIHIQTNRLVFPGSLLIDNTHPGFALSSGEIRIEGHLTLTNGGSLHLQASPVSQPAHAGGRLVVTGDLTVPTGCTVFVYSHPTNGGSFRLQVGGLIVDNGGAISANGLGFQGGSSVRRNGHGPGYGLYASSRISGSGAGYGGQGQRNYYNDSGHRGAIYGKPLAPIEPGSGGASANVPYVSNFGGGLIWIEAMGAIVNNGRVSANGESLSALHRSGASGGGILLTGNRFSGGGVLSANGSTADNRGGGGGGGRICVWVPSLTEEAILEIAQDILPRESTVQETIPWGGTATVAFGSGHAQSATAESGTIRYGLVSIRKGTVILIR